MKRGELNVSKNLIHLQLLRECIESVPQKYIDPSVWRKNNESDDVLFECKTVACFLGWACAYPPLKEEGLRYSQSKGAPMYLNYRGLVAAEHFFGICLFDANFLFSPWRYDETPSSQYKKEFLSRLNEICNK